MSTTVLCTYSKMLLQEHFSCTLELDLKFRDTVVLETRRGLEIGTVAALPGSTPLRKDEGIGGKVLRRPTPEEREAHRNTRTAFSVPAVLRQAIAMTRELGLDMEIVDLEQTMDGAKLIFYFTAETRIDFRNLVRAMGTQFGKRIELRQIGARDVARLVGDVGSCGEELCCKTFLIDFVPVSMKMAKNQGASLDTAKISGMCGRLKCCLKYEDQLYTQLRKTVPLHGQPVTVRGNEEGWACSVDVLNQSVTVNIAGKREDFPASEVVFDPTMSEGAVRRWQREMRERLRIEREEKKAAWEARRAARGGDRRMSGTRSDQPDRREGERRPATMDTPEQASRAATASGESAEPVETAEHQALPQDAGKPESGGEPGAMREGSASDQEPRKRRRRRRGRRRGDRAAPGGAGAEASPPSGPATASGPASEPTA